MVACILETSIPAATGRRKATIAVILHGYVMIPSATRRTTHL